MDAVATHVLAVVSSACRLCRSVYDADEDFAPARKGDGSPVTVCDFAIQAHVTGELRRRGLALPLVAEEDLKDASPQDLAVVRKLVEKFADHAFPREALPTPAAATARAGATGTTTGGRGNDRLVPKRRAGKGYRCHGSYTCHTIYVSATAAACTTPESAPHCLARSCFRGG